MAKTSSFGFTNTTTAQNKAITLKTLGNTNYALVADEPTECRLVNKTAPVDREEILTFRCKDLNHVNTQLDVINPAKVRAGMQYQVQMEAIWTTEDPDVGLIVQEPIIVQISVRQPKSGNITSEAVQTMVARAASALLNTDGSWRIPELMRSALKPTTNF